MLRALCSSWIVVLSCLVSLACGSGGGGSASATAGEQDPCIDRDCLGLPWHGSPSNGGIAGSCCDFTFFKEAAFKKCTAGEHYFPCEDGLECVPQDMSGDINFGMCVPPDPTGGHVPCSDPNLLSYGVDFCPFNPECDPFEEYPICDGNISCGCGTAPEFCSVEAYPCTDLCPPGTLCDIAPSGDIVCCGFGADESSSTSSGDTDSTTSTTSGGGSSGTSSTTVG
jgi:hypothetical protein